MSNDFENAVHQGFTAADMAADMSERASRMRHLGCFDCKHGMSVHPTCLFVIENDDRYPKCPYFKNGG